MLTIILRRWLLPAATLAARLLPVGVANAIYRFPLVASLIRKGLNRAVSPGVQNVVVAGGMLKGLRLQLDLTQEKDYWLGTYEPDLMRACRELTEPGMIAYDLGANIGYITLLLAKIVGDTGRVFAFEAHPANVARLEANIALNRFNDRVTIVPAAVTMHSQPTRFFSGPSSATGKVAGSAGRDSLNYRDAIRVEGISIDDFILQQGNPAPQIVKMDIEGGEVLALPGMVHTLKEARPILLLELHGEEAARTAWQVLGDTNYRVSTLNPGFPRVESPEDLGWKAYLAAFPEAGG